MKKDLIKFIEKETGFVNHQIIDSVKKYFKGLEVEWKEKEKQMDSLSGRNIKETPKPKKKKKKLGKIVTKIKQGIKRGIDRRKRKKASKRSYNPYD